MVEAKKEWMEEFRGWVEMLGGFLEEKARRAHNRLNHTTHS
jgi:hypothetical protein